MNGNSKMKAGLLGLGGACLMAFADATVGQVIRLQPLPEAIIAGYGGAVAGADFDGDGVGDVLVGSAGEMVGNDPSRGRVHVYSGRTGALIRTIVPPSLGLSFGELVATSPDVTGDGRPEMIIAGDAYPECNPNSSGGMYVVNGFNYSFVHIFCSPANLFGASFANSISSVPDVDGDGVADFVAGSDGEGADEGGRVYVFSGAGGQTLRILASPVSTPDGAYFGYRVAGVSDLNHNGSGDIIVSVPRERVVAGGRRGVTYVFDGATGEVIHRLPWRSFQVASLPDVDADGVADLLLANDLENPDGTEGSGLVRIVSGRTGELIRLLQSPLPQAHNEFGFSVQGFADIDGDGAGDLIVGARSEAQPGTPSQSGTVYVLSGRTGAQLYRFVSPTPRFVGWFGASVGVLPDANGDRRPDFVIGEPGNWDSLHVSGSVYIVYAPPNDGGPGGEPGDAGNSPPTGGGNVSGPCRADWDRSGTVDSADLFAFLADFFASRADFNRDGVTDSSDLFDFLAAFFAGCP